MCIAFIASVVKYSRLPPPFSAKRCLIIPWTDSKSNGPNSKLNVILSSKLGYSCIIDRSDQKVLIKDKIISQIKFKIDTFKSDNLPDKLKKIAPIKPGSRSLSK